MIIVADRAKFTHTGTAMTDIFRVLLIVVFSGVLPACGDPAQTPVRVNDLQVFAPVPGSTTGVAYFELHNPNAGPVVLTRVSSPQFDRVEMHQTTYKDGLSAMQQLDNVGIDGRSSAKFVSGGRHLMLMRPPQAMKPGDNMELRFHFDDGHVVIATTTMQSRFNGD